MWLTTRIVIAMTIGWFTPDAFYKKGEDGQWHHRVWVQTLRQKLLN